MKKVTIIGAGIGGLTTAIALLQRGFTVELFENAPAFKKAGSGINLALNAMQVYKRLGLYDDIFKEANYTNSINVRKKNMKFITQAKFQGMETEFGVKTVAIHRAVLHDILLKHAKGATIHLNKKLTTLEQKSNGVTLTFEDGTVHTSDIVIGADGIHSAVRKSIFEDTELRDAEQICWRGISKANVGNQYNQQLNEIWGKGKRFGFVNINKDEIYWFGLINKGEQSEKTVNFDQIFSDFPEVVKEIIGGTPKEDIICNEIWDLKPIEQWYKGNVCLVGDACHATTPNMGQGAVQAIESAFALSICLAEEASCEKAFKRYQEIRQKKAVDVVKTSWFIGKIAQSENAVVCFIRDFFGTLTPNKMAQKKSKELFKLNY